MKTTTLGKQYKKFALLSGHLRKTLKRTKAVKNENIYKFENGIITGLKEMPQSSILKIPSEINGEPVTKIERCLILQNPLNRADLFFCKIKKTY